MAKKSGNCEKCGTWRMSLHRDHIVPRFKGGTDDADNIQLICANCHEDKTRRDFTGQPLHPNTRASLVGRTVSAVTRSKIALANARRVWTDESRRKRSIGQVGRTLSEETKAKISASKSGRTASDGAREHMSAAAKARCIRDGVPWRKLTDQQVSQIRESDSSTADLARQLGVSATVVRRVRMFESYRHVPVEADDVELAS